MADTEMYVSSTYNSIWANADICQSVAVPAEIVDETSEPAKVSPQPESPTRKRRNSLESEQDSKRPRLDTSKEEARDDYAEEAVKTAQHSPDVASRPADQSNYINEGARRRERIVDEKKRGKRLFGSLLGTISQSSVSSAQRRRVEIEKKQQAKLRALDEEHEEDKKKRLEAIKAQRKIQQKHWDEQATRIRHDNLRAAACMLTTKSEPKLYYMPYELSREQKETIQRQRDDAEQQIADELGLRRPLDEVAQARLSPEQRTDASTSEGIHVNGETTLSAEAQKRPNAQDDAAAEHGGAEGETEIGANEDAPVTNGEPVRADIADDDKADENEDVMVEAGEDSVIY